MSKPLETLSNAELSEVFAVEVAGWTRGNFMRGDMPWYDGPVTRKGGHMGFPSFADSADTVLPYMRNYQYVDISREHEDPPREWCVVVAVTRESRIYIGQAPTFARAACIALITAKRAENNTAKA